MPPKIRTHVDLLPTIHAKLEQVAEMEGTTMSEHINAALAAYFKAKREGISYDVALALTRPPQSEEEEKHRDYLKVAQDAEKPARVRIEAYIAARHDIPEDLKEAARDILADPDLTTERDEAHYEDAEEGLRYIPAGFERYRMTREYWWDPQLIVSPETQEKYVAYRIALGFDELAMRQRLAQILANPPNETETAYDWYARIHKCSIEEAASRIARGD